MKKKNWKRQRIKILTSRHFSERESLMQLKYWVDSINSKTNDKYYLLDVFFWTINNRKGYGGRRERWQVQKKDSVCLHNGWDRRELPLGPFFWTVTKNGNENEDDCLCFSSGWSQLTNLLCALTSIIRSLEKSLSLSSINRSALLISFERERCEQEISCSEEIHSDNTEKFSLTCWRFFRRNLTDRCSSVSEVSH